MDQKTGIYDYIRNKEIKKFATGEIIFSEGDPSNELILVVMGFLDCYSNYNNESRTRFRTVVPGSLLGEASLFLGKPRDCTAVSRGETSLLMMDKDAAIDLMRNVPEAMFTMVQSRIREYERTGVGIFANAVPLRSVKKPERSLTNPSKLFPDGHRKYKLTFASPDSEFLFEKKFSCPVCGKSFKTAAVRTSKLVTDNTDVDLRVHYKGIEPLYYDIISCPACWYSALQDQFTELSSLKRKAAKEMLEQYKDSVNIGIGFNKTADDVFSGYYMALRCAEVSQQKPHMTYAKLWMKISRVYSDAGDDKLAMYALEQARDAYQYVFERTTIAANQNQQLCYILGYLYQKFGDYGNARKLYFEAKIDKIGNKMISRLAEDRIDEMKMSNTTSVPCMVEA